MVSIWHNGEFKQDGPVLSIHDRIRLGEGVFNTMLVIDGHIHHIDTHMEKMLRNSKVFLGEWDMPDVESLKTAAHELLDKNGFTSGRYAFNTILTGGPGKCGIKTPDNPEPQILMRALPCPDSFPPVQAIIAQSVRRNEGSPLSQFKCSNFGDNILALREAQSKGANDAILLNNKGNVTCASTANITIIKDGALITPPLSDGAQGGVTRGILLQKYNVVEQSFTAEDLENSEEIYLTNSLRGAVSVVSLNGRNLPPPSLQISKDFHLE